MPFNTLFAAMVTTKGGPIQRFISVDAHILADLVHLDEEGVPQEGGGGRGGRGGG